MEPSQLCCSYCLCIYLLKVSAIIFRTLLSGKEAMKWTVGYTAFGFTGRCYRRSNGKLRYRIWLSPNHRTSLQFLPSRTLGGCISCSKYQEHLNLLISPLHDVQNVYGNDAHYSVHLLLDFRRTIALQLFSSHRVDLPTRTKIFYQVCFNFERLKLCL